MDYALTFGIAASLFFSFFFACFEVAYMAASKLKIEQDAHSAALNARILYFFVQRPTWLVGSTRVGYCTALVLFGYFMAQVMLPQVSQLLPRALHHTIVTIIVQILFSAILILLTAQFLPKILGNIYPNRVMSVSAILFAFASIILSPLTYIILTISKVVVVKFFHQKINDKQPLFGITNLNQYFKNIYNVKQDNVNLDLDKKILQNALEFKTVKIRECMIPRNEITAIDIAEGLEKLQKIFIESGHSKIIIYRNNIDDIIGYCHSSSLFTMPSKIEDILAPVITVHETSLASDLMRRFLAEKESLAVVMDEFGGTSGIVSREDVIEEIFGEIEDEYDQDDLVEEKLDDDQYLFSARLEIDYLNERYNLELPIGEYETLGGMILAYTEDFPEAGETITIGAYTFSIQATHHNRIDTVKMSLEPKPAET